MKILVRFLFVAALVTAQFSMSYGQCRGFAKKECYPKLAPYTHNGRLYSAVMQKGQISQIHITFNGGMRYRILNCASKDAAETAQFKLMDKKNNVLFDNKQHDLVQSWDFAVESTQEFIIEINIPKPKKSFNAGSVCSVVLIGFIEDTDGGANSQATE